MNSENNDNNENGLRPITNGRMQKIKRSLLACLSCLVMVLMFQNCSAVRAPNESQNSTLGLSEQEVLGKQAIDILNTKCLSCHNPDKPEGGISDINDLGYLLYYRLVIPGQPEISDIIRVIKEGTMPPGSKKLSTDELSALNKWIMEGLIDSSGNVAVPGGSATLEPTFNSIKVRIFNTKCISCHTAGNIAGGTNLDSYDTLIASNRIIAGNPAGSRLVLSVERTGNDFMPRGGGRLSAEELAAIRLWIQNGALR